VLPFAILAIVTGCNSYRGIVTFISVHRRRLNTVFALKWRRAPAHTAVRYIHRGLDPATVEAVFRRHAALLETARATTGQGSIALDGKTLRSSFDKLNDRAVAQVLSAFASDTALVLAHMDIAGRSNEIPAAQTLLAELGVADGSIVTLDGLHCQKTFLDRSSQRRPDRRGQGQPADPAPENPRGRGHHDTARVSVRQLSSDYVAGTSYGGSVVKRSCLISWRDWIRGSSPLSIMRQLGRITSYPVGTRAVRTTIPHA